MTAVGLKKPPPIYTHNLPAIAWRLLWWLMCMMDEKCEVHGGWRSHAAKALNSDRLWIGKCAEHLTEHGLIETRKGLRRVKVIVSAINAS